MIYKIAQIEDVFLDNVYKESINDLNNFYEIGWEHHLPKIIVVDNRKAINLLKGEETENWIIGWSEGKTIYVLDRNNFNKESDHKYDPVEYSAFIKHELSHSFYSVLSCGQWKPIWLNEGLAIYTSGQNKFKKQPTEFKNFLESYDNSGKEIYGEAGFAIEFLIKKFGKEKLLNFIKNLKRYSSKELFAEVFEREFGFSLSYKEFNNLIP